MLRVRKKLRKKDINGGENKEQAGQEKEKKEQDLEEIS